MARPKDLLRTVTVERAKRRRGCAQNKAHAIAGGDLCLVFHEQQHTKSYCIACAQGILDRAQRHMALLRDELREVGQLILLEA